MGHMWGHMRVGGGMCICSSTQVMPPGEYRRYNEYKKMLPTKAGWTGTFFAEIGQSPCFGSSCGALMPTLTRNGDIFEYKCGA